MLGLRRGPVRNRTPPKKYSACPNLMALLKDECGGFARALGRT